MRDGFLRVATATPQVRVADCTYNAERIIELARQAAQQDSSLVVFPELCVTAYTCGDLFLQTRLLDSAEAALFKIAQQTATLDLIIVVGVPIRDFGALYNCAAVLFHGSILGLIPKRCLPNYAELSESRYFMPGPAYKTVTLAGQTIPLGYELIFSCRSMPAFRLGIEVCEDLLAGSPLSSRLARSGATVIANPSASSEIIGRAEYLRSLVLMQSARLKAAYLYSNAGDGESTTDLVFAGHSMIAENGTMLSESPMFTTGLTTADIDLSRLESERRRVDTFSAQDGEPHTVWFDLPLKALDLRRVFKMHPFVPPDKEGLDKRCGEVLALQAAGLLSRLRHTGIKTAVIGLSGGLDSALALIVTVRAFDALSYDRSGIVAVTMPCFGTTERTKNNARALALSYGVTLREIPIDQAVRQHFLDISHREDIHDITYENAQARERTQVLMDIANQTGGLVVGTGDMSELALGWVTYNGDHMSMYAVNASVPKTLVRHLVSYEAERVGGKTGKVLKDILDTPISPELLPPAGKDISQQTENIIGPYELHDFFLYYMLRFGYSPKKIFRISCIAFSKSYTPKTIKKWLVVFLKRFFSSQFKRSCMPDSPKIGTVSLSPRGALRMPSDAVSDEWLREAEKIEV